MKVVALGADSELAGFVLVGVEVFPVDTDDEVRRTWATLGDDVALVIATPRVADVLGDELEARPTTLTVVTP
jgi:vacuolar-type H+-ATPase subunit F/Vma7